MKTSTFALVILAVIGSAVAVATVSSIDTTVQVRKHLVYTQVSHETCIYRSTEMTVDIDAIAQIAGVVKVSGDDTSEVTITIDPELTRWNSVRGQVEACFYD